MENENTASTVDLQIVGAGLAGLLAANLALDAGFTVRLIERTTTPGGRAASVGHHGYLLNVGPHALYLQGELRRALRGLGIDPAGARPDTSGGTGSIGDRVGLLPFGATSLLRTRLLSAASKRDLGRFLSKAPRLDPAELASVTVDTWLDGFTTRPDARSLIDGIINLTTYNPASDRASVDAVVAQLKMGLDEGVRYVDRGWVSIVEELAERADRLGVSRVAATVREVRQLPAAAPDDPTTIVSTTDGDSYKATTCLIAAGGPAVADRLLGLDGQLTAAAGPAVEASVLDLGLRHRPPVGIHLGLDRQLYGTVHSEAAGLVPTGRHLVSLARYRRPGDDTDPDHTRDELSRHGRQMGIEPDHIEMERYLHRLTVTGGMPLAERGGLAGRPAVTVADRPGVFIAGDWVGDRGLLADASAASASDAVQAASSNVADRRARLVGS